RPLRRADGIKSRLWFICSRTRSVAGLWPFYELSVIRVRRLPVWTGFSGTHRKPSRPLSAPCVGTVTNQGHRIKIGGLERMANPAFGKNLSFCGTSSRVFTRFVAALVIVNKYNLYVQYLVIIENPRKLREKRRGGPATVDRQL